MMDRQAHTASKPAGETVAVVGMACCFPQAPDLDTFWRNIIHKVDAVTDAPPERWDTDRFYDPDFSDRGKIYARRGGYLDSPFHFNAAEFGIMPKAVTGGEPDQFLVLQTAAAALHHAGIAPGGPDHAKTAFILGRGSYLSAGAFNLVQRTVIADQTVRLVSQLHPDLSADDRTELKDNLLASLKPFEAETAPSVMPNITAGRVANRLGLMGPNYTIDAACASSLYAVDAAVSALLAGRSDLALAGGVHIFNNIPFLNVFCTLGAMSKTDRIRPFDVDADGMLPGEGAGIIVLKRTADAQRDGDRIYAVIRGVGSSSDGRGGSVAAPRVEGEVLALERAYQAAGVSPATIGLIEAHGTATRVGDAAEIRSLSTVFGQKDNGTPRHCALGAVKSMIGHAMPAAGIASLIKTVLALHHKVLPPTLHCEQPHPDYALETTPFYVNTETRPWFRLSADIPRRAGVNAFGFGGVNAHVVLEEYREPPAAVMTTVSADSDRPAKTDCGPDWDAALYLFSDVSRAGLVTACQKMLERIGDGAAFDWRAAARDLLRQYAPDEQRLAIIAGSAADLAKKLEYAVGRLKAPNCKKIKDVKGIYYFGTPLGKTGKVAFMFPGEGAAYTNMMMDLCLRFAPVRQYFAEMDRTITGRRTKSRYLPSQFIFPATLLTAAEDQALEAEFWKVDSGLQAILAASLAMNDLLHRFAVAPDMIVGHSAGEYSAWIASGILDKESLYARQEEIAAIYADRRGVPETSMIAISAAIGKVRPILDKTTGDVHISNDNCPHQVVAVGEAAAMDRFRAALKEARLLYTDLPSREVHHTPMAAHQAAPLMSAFSALPVAAPETPVYSPVTAAPYPDAPKGILDLMVRYWLRQLRFRETIEAMYADGARIFIEVGPGNNLCGFVDDILRGKSAMTVPANTSRRSGTVQLCHLLGMLAAQHVDLSLEALLAAQPVHPPGQKTDVDGQSETRKAATVALDLGLPELRWNETGLAAWRKRLTPAPPALEKTEPAPAPTPGPGDTVFPSLPFDKGAAAPEKTTANRRARTMEKYLNTMSRFLDLQQEIALAATGRRPGPPAPGEPSSRETMPMVDKKTTREDGAVLRIERDITLGRDIFLRDHPFGGDVSEINNRLAPLIVTPLTLNLEIMAEAAALAFPDQVPVGLRNVKASRWVVVDEESGVRLAAEARQDKKEESAVRLYALSGGRAASAESRVLFAGDYPEPVPVQPVPEKIDSPNAREQAREMYAQKFMTHGPRFQVITALTLTDQNEMTAALRAPEDHNLFAAGQRGNFLLNPLLLDACAQMTGYWGQQVLTEGFITFPAGVGEIRFYTPPPRPGDRPWCRMRIREISDQVVRSDLVIGHADSRIWAQVHGWTHRRFELPAELYRFWRFPRRHLVGSVAKDAGSDDGAARCTVPYYDQLSGTIWQKAIAYLYLNSDERRIYKEKLGQGETAGRWLSRQIAAKDAVRIFLGNSRDRMMAPADLTLRSGQNGYLFPESPLISGVEQQLTLSVTPKDSAVSVTVLPGKPIRKQEVG